jgi:hypothetical protein
MDKTLVARKLIALSSFAQARAPRLTHNPCSNRPSLDQRQSNTRGRSGRAGTDDSVGIPSGIRDCLLQPLTLPFFNALAHVYTRPTGALQHITASLTLSLALPIHCVLRLRGSRARLRSVVVSTSDVDRCSQRAEQEVILSRRECNYMFSQRKYRPP